MIVVTAQEMQAIDKHTIEGLGLPGMVLMENAGRGCVEALWQHFPRLKQMRVGIAAGRGNNGGDGFVIARYLSHQGIGVTVFLLATKDLVSGDAATNLKLLDPTRVEIHEIPTDEALTACLPHFEKPQIWVDAILGTGLNAAVRGRYKRVIDHLNQSRKPILAVDIPSGIDANTGQIHGTALQAQATVTFGHPKIGHLQYPGRKLAGTVYVVDIGIPPAVTNRMAPPQQLLTLPEIRCMLPDRRPDDHKGRTGHVLVIGGTPGKTGAPVMAANSAVRAGAGLVTLGAAKDLSPIIEPQILEPMSVPLPQTESGVLGLSALETIRKQADGKRCVAIGPGLGTHPETVRLVQQWVAESEIPLVIDADGLNALALSPAPFKKARTDIIITPHPGEMSRLMGIATHTIQSDRIGHARRYATDNGIWVVLKGASTVIAAPEGQAWLNPTGNPGMASGGMGDVLTGIIAGFVAQRLRTAQAACAGVYLHGLAADYLAQAMAPWGYGAGDLINAIPRVLNEQVLKAVEIQPSFVQRLPI